MDWSIEKIRTLYPEHAKDADKGGYFYGPSSYQPIIDAIGVPFLQVDDSDYQGDTRVLLTGADGRIGLLIFGWGSCSGCDGLQACNSLKDIAELAQSTADGVQWFDSRAAALAYVNEHDWEGDHSWHKEETRDFVQKAKAALASEQPRAATFDSPKVDQ